MIELIELFSGIIASFISFVGYLGIFILMALESTATPVPSELVMPFAGYLAGTGRFNIFWTIIIGTLGSVCGAAFSYGIGRYWGDAFVKRFGKFLLISQHEMKWTEKWFRNNGDKTILISRFIPVIRHLISIPAGAGKMNFAKFLFYTFIGALGWVSILTYAGIKLGENWMLLRQFTEKISLLIIALIIIAASIFIWKHLKK